MNVLIVDDAEIDRERLQRKLERECQGGYTVATCSTGSEGLEQLSNCDFDCVLLDYRLPDMTGLEFIQKTRESDSLVNSPAIVVLTGAGDPCIDQGAASLGAFDYLIKDEISTESLERSLRYAIELNRKMGALKEANRVKDDFMAAMSHEMRTPLNAIINFSGYLEKGIYGPLEPKHLDIIHRINQAGEHLQSIVEGVFTAMSFERDKRSIHLNLESVDLINILRFSIELMEVPARDKGLKLIESLPRSLPYKGDRHKLGQIFLNILSNAIKFTDSGQVTIRAEECDGDFLIQVTDTGIGIDEKDIEIVTEPFRQVEEGISRRYGGVGLGLSISLALARLHGGDLRIDSELGRGTTVTVALPDPRQHEADESSNEKSSARLTKP